MTRKADLRSQAPVLVFPELAGFRNQIVVDAATKRLRALLRIGAVTVTDLGLRKGCWKRSRHSNRN